jgi:hypothetical protein
MARRFRDCQNNPARSALSANLVADLASRVAPWPGGDGAVAPADGALARRGVEHDRRVRKLAAPGIVAPAGPEPFRGPATYLWVKNRSKMVSFRYFCGMPHPERPVAESPSKNTAWNQAECDGMWWNVMECGGMWWNVVECDGMWWNGSPAPAGGRTPAATSVERPGSRLDRRPTARFPSRRGR